MGAAFRAHVTAHDLCQVIRYDYFAASEAPRKDREAPMYRVGKSAFGSGMRARMYSRVRIRRMHVRVRCDLQSR